MSDNTCGRCGKNPSLGFAWIGDVWFCSGTERPSCFELAQQETAGASVVKKTGEAQ